MQLLKNSVKVTKRMFMERMRCSSVFLYHLFYCVTSAESLFGLGVFVQ